MRRVKEGSQLAIGRTSSQTTPQRSRLVTMMTFWWRGSFILPLSEWGGWNGRNSSST
jgi:hypothetical protein